MKRLTWAHTQSLALLAAPLLVACSSGDQPSGPTTGSAVIGPAGGQVTAKGIVLSVPAGALTASTLISVDVSSDVPPAPYVALSPLYRFVPDGLTFAVPATVTMEAPGATSLPTDASVLWSTGTSGAYGRLPTTVTGSTATAIVAHFSSGFLGFVPADAGSDASTMGDASDATISEAGPVDGANADVGDATVDVAPEASDQADASGDADGAGNADGQVDAGVDGGVTSVSGVVRVASPFPYQYGDTVMISVQELSNVPDGSGGCSSQTATGEQQVTIPATALPYLYRLTFPAGVDDPCTGRSYAVQAVASTGDGGLETSGINTCTGTSGGTISCDDVMVAPPSEVDASGADASDGSAVDAADSGDAADANVDGGNPYFDPIVFTGTITGTVPAGTSWISVQLSSSTHLYATGVGGPGPSCASPTAVCEGEVASELLLPSLPATFTLTVGPTGCTGQNCGPNGEPFCGAQFGLEVFAADANGQWIVGTTPPSPVGCGSIGSPPVLFSCAGVVGGGPEITSDSVDCGTFVMQ
jgi:hypothetical protein